MRRFSTAVMFLVAFAGSAWADDSKVLARVGLVYIDEHGLGGLSVHEPWLTRQADGTLKGREGDQLVSGKGGTVDVRLGVRKGTFTVAVKDGVRTIDGEWGTGYPSHPVHIELADDHLYMKWGFYERTMKPVQAPQLPAECRRYARDDGSVASRWIDVLDLCGDALKHEAPTPELVTALLLNGFRKDVSSVAGAPGPSFAAGAPSPGQGYHSNR